MAVINGNSLDPAQEAGGSATVGLISPRCPSQSPNRSIQWSTGSPFGLMPKAWPPFS